MPTPRSLDVVYRDRRKPLAPQEYDGQWVRFSAVCLMGLWAAYLGTIAPVVLHGFASVTGVGTAAGQGASSLGAAAAMGFVLMAHLVATGLGVCVALVSLVVVHASGVAVPRLPFGVALGGAVLSVMLLQPATTPATATVQLLAMLGTGAYGAAGTWRVWQAGRSRASVTA